MKAPFSGFANRLGWYIGPLVPYGTAFLPVALKPGALGAIRPRPARFYERRLVATVQFQFPDPSSSRAKLCIVILKIMDRRNFFSTSLSASVLSLAGAASAAPQSPGAEYFDLRRYQLANGHGTMLTERYFAGALIPALNRLGIGPVGAFSIYFGPDTPAYYLLLPSTKLETLVTADLQVAKDAAFMKAAAPFWDAPGDAAPYIKIESTLLRAFEGYPKLTVPAAAIKKEERVYQLRTYVSPTNMDHVRKVEMFHHGEFSIFAKAGAASVFYADALIGPRLPSLTYMLSFRDVAALEAAWAKFVADPDWKKLSADPRFKLDPPTVSNITSLVLRPLPCSQV